MYHTGRKLVRLNTISRVLHYSSGKVDINGVKLYYEKCGQGKQTLLLLHGALGSIHTDFDPQLKGLNKEKFTLVSLEHQGYGNSIPPERDFPMDYLERDADNAAALMQKLGLEKYSVLGWSDGGNCAAILAAKYPDVVENLIIWGANSYVSQEDIKICESTRDVSTWSKAVMESMKRVYTEDYIQKTWSALVDWYIKVWKENNGEIYTSLLKNIKAPTLIIHGMKDPLVPSFHVKYLHDNIKGSVVDLWPDGKHNVNIRFPEKFNAKVEEFLIKG